MPRERSRIDREFLLPAFHLADDKDEICTDIGGNAAREICDFCPEMWTVDGDLISIMTDEA